MSSPCMNCADRVVETNCHMSSAKYLQFSNKCNAVNEARKQYYEDRKISVDRSLKIRRNAR